MLLKIGINGYGTIGRRLAHAIAKQDDMKVVGAAKTRPDFKAMDAVNRGVPLYCSVPGNESKFKEAGMELAGSLEDLLSSIDLVIDCAPSKMGLENKALYEKHGLKMMFQGGEKSSTAEVSFNAQNNYADAIGKQSVRVVSCNTTGLARTLGDVRTLSDTGKVRTVMVRRAADPGQSNKGPINAIKPTPEMPSHHGPDLKTVIPGINIMSIAFAVSSTLMHSHAIMAELAEPLDRETILNKFRENPRVRVYRVADGFKTTAEVMEHAKDLGRDMSDMYEIIVWDECLNVSEDGKELYYMQAVHQESDVVPENIDCIRALGGIESDPLKSMEKTNKTLGVGAGL
ncbi:type II glyceraldehyde-3-phosphate dehydrogenase [archaeon]|nr:type II glyceraldehyde-3-phosphate dehydrogenase [archaeon]